METTVKLGYCPTMTPFVKNFKSRIDELELVPMQGAAAVMNMLLAGALDAAIIGREAYSRELNPSIKKKRLQSGYTLVYKDKVGIPRDKLKEISIKTYLPRDITMKLLPTLEHVSFYPSLHECEEAGKDMPMLIDWKDFKDEYEMLIPIEEDGMKTPIYRAPVIFYKEEIEDFVNLKLDKIYS